MEVKVGDLVKNKRASLGVPKGLLGLVVETRTATQGDLASSPLGWMLYNILWMGTAPRSSSGYRGDNIYKKRRTWRIGQDLEVLK